MNEPLPRVQLRLMTSIRNGLLVIALLFLFMRVFSYQISTRSSQATALDQQDLEIQNMPEMQPRRFPKCSSVVASKTDQLEFNITTDPHFDAKGLLIIVGEREELRKALRGEIQVLRGTIFQTSDVDVRMIVRTNNESEVYNVGLYREGSILGVSYAYTGDPDLCTEVEVLIFLRPYPSRVLDFLAVLSRIFDISIGPSLNWEFNNFATDTHYGETIFNYNSGVETHYGEPIFNYNSGVETQIIHNLSLISRDGSIGGNYFAEENLVLSNDGGNIYGTLVPKYKGPPLDPKLINITTKSGDIRIQSGIWGHEWDPKPYTHQTKIETESGNIFARIPHGSTTEISSTSGDISAVLQPYGKDTLDAESKIYVEITNGTLDLDVKAMHKRSTGKYNPLNHTFSSHKVESGNLKLTYPYDWWGVMMTNASNGTIDFNASRLKEIDRGDGYVYAVRGENGRSLMNAQISSGNISIRIGL